MLILKDYRRSTSVLDCHVSNSRKCRSVRMEVRLKKVVDFIPPLSHTASSTFCRNRELVLLCSETKTTYWLSNQFSGRRGVFKWGRLSGCLMWRKHRSVCDEEKSSKRVEYISHCTFVSSALCRTIEVFLARGDRNACSRSVINLKQRGVSTLTRFQGILMWNKHRRIFNKEEL